VRLVRTPLGVALITLAAYVVWAAYYAAHHDLVDLARVGHEFVTRAPGESRAIDELVPDTFDESGYDGQFFLYIAVDPTGAEPYVDEPPYRYSRIVYPLLARAVAVGQPDLAPFALLLINLLAVGAGTFAVATLLRGLGLSPWYGALYGLYPGLFVGVSHDLSEPLAYAFAACALLAFERRRVPLAAVLFALAGLTRESTLLFPAALALWLAIGRRRHRDAAVLAASVIPYLALRVGLWVWLGAVGNAQAQRIEVLPFAGLAKQWPWDTLTLEEIYAVVVPGVLALVIAVLVRARPGWLLVLAANVVVLVVFLPEPSYAEYRASGRITIGVVLAFLLCLPRVLAAGRTAQAWIVVLLWFAPWYDLLPAAFER
jgi:hypothetical protein